MSKALFDSAEFWAQIDRRREPNVKDNPPPPRSVPMPSVPWRIEQDPRWGKHLGVPLAREGEECRPAVWSGRPLIEPEPYEIPAVMPLPRVGASNF